MLLPSICFQGNCDEAISYYKETIDAQVKTINYFRDAPADSGMEGLPPDFVMYSEVSMFGMTMVMTDGAENPMTSEPFWFTLSFDTPEEVTAVFNKLAADGKVTDPLASQFWAALNGSVEDRFGVHWNIGTNN